MSGALERPDDSVGRSNEHGSTSSAVGAPAGDDDAKPIPPRYWWLKRLTLAGVCVVVGLVLLRVWWGYKAQSLLDAEIARYRAAGQLVYAHEFDEMLDAVPDDENAAVLYEEAMTLHTNITTPVMIEDWMMKPERIAEEPEPIRKLIEANAGVFDLIREARNREAVNWSPRIANVVFVPTLAPYSLMRQIAKLLMIRASWQIHTGDHAGAIETYADALRFGEATAADPLLISNLVAWACQGLTLSMIGEQSAVLRIDRTAKNAVNGIRPASRASVESLIARLLDESRCRRSFVQTWYGERSLVFSYWQSQTSNTVPRAAGGRSTVFTKMADALKRPLEKVKLVRAGRWYTSLAEHAAKATWPEAARDLDPDPVADSFVSSLSESLTTTPFPAGSLALSGFHQLLAMRRMAAIALAIRLYELDHKDRPVDLALLVPDYLPAVPIDPFSPDSGPIRYIHDRDPPILYTVWKDGEDNQGRERNEKRGSEERWWVGLDRTLHLRPRVMENDG